jgi:hypothetical protein
MVLNQLRRLSIIPLLIFTLLSTHSYAQKNYVSSENNKLLKDTIPGKCPKSEEVEKIISDAISLGAPIYNAGLHNGCYRIYEWAAYKILYEYGKTCADVEKLLKLAIEKSHGDYSDIEKAWMMRAAFDKILGVPTKIEEKEKPPAVGNG